MTFIKITLADRLSSKNMFFPLILILDENKYKLFK